MGLPNSLAVSTAVPADAVSHVSQHVRYRLDRGVAHLVCLDHVAEEEQNSASLALVWRSQVKPSSRGQVGKPHHSEPRTTQATDAESGNATGAHQAKGTAAQRPGAELSAPKLEHDHLCNETKFESFLVDLSGGRSVALEDQVVEMLVEGRHVLEQCCKTSKQPRRAVSCDTDLFQSTQRSRTPSHRTYPMVASQVVSTTEQDRWWH